jgi:hypothetical protein
MSDALYGLDPELTNYGRIAKRSTPDPNVMVGLGSPRQFPFTNGPTLDAVWTASATPPGWIFNQVNGVLQINAVNSNAASNQTQTIWISTAFDLANMVTITFRIRVPEVINADAVYIGLGAGIYLNVTDLGRVSNWGYARNGAVLASSQINTSSGWVDVVMLLTADRVVLWENGEMAFSLNEYPGDGDNKRNVEDAGNAVTATFFVELLGAQSSARVELMQVSVTAATDSPVPLATRLVAPRNQDSTIQQLSAIVPAITTAATQLSATLRDLSETKIGPWQMFFGYEPDSLAKSAAAQIIHNVSVQNFITKASQAHAALATDNGVKTGSTFYLGIGMSAAYVVAGGYSLGFLFDVSKSPVRTALVLNIGGGGGIALGVSGHVDVGWYPLSIDDILGWGATLFIDGGEVFVASFSVSGNIPLHLATWDNCGPVFTVGVGVGIPVELGGLINRTMEMSRW